MTGTGYECVCKHPFIGETTHTGAKCAQFPDAFPIPPLHFCLSAAANETKVLDSTTADACIAKCSQTWLDEATPCLIAEFDSKSARCVLRFRDVKPVDLPADVDPSDPPVYFVREVS